MVTRYTIDQILSRGPSSSSPTSPLSTMLSTTPQSPLWRPTSLTHNPAQSSHHTTADRKVKEDHHTDAKIESSTSDDDMKTWKRKEGRAEDIQSLARPVPLRLPHSFSLPPCETTTLEAFGPRSDLSYSGLEGSLYELMFRQYMEAQYHLGSPRTFLPIPFQGFNSGLHPGGSGRTRRRGGQVRFTPHQTRELETWFAQHKYITPPQRKTIARELSLQEKQVKTWFQNRRAKWRKVQAQGSGEEGGAAAVDMTASSPASSHDGSEDDLEHHLAGEELEVASSANESSVVFKK